MRKFFTLFLALAAMTNVFAAGTKIGDLYYNLFESDTTATVTYNTKTAANYNYLTKVEIPLKVSYNNKEYKVTGIGEYAFQNAVTITSVYIASYVKIIGKQAFSGCTKLSDLDIRGGLANILTDAFEDCSSLITVRLACNALVSKDFKENSNLSHIFGPQVTYYDISDGVKTIGSHAFHGCTTVKDITIANTVTTIGDYAFNGCTNLRPFTLPNSVTSVGRLAFWNCAKLTTPIYNDYIYAFMPPSLLATSVIIPEGIQVIATDAFNRCTELQSVTLPESLKRIGFQAFWRCSALKNVEIPNSVEFIGPSVFEDSGLRRVSLGKNVAEIRDYAFYGCSYLEEIWNYAVTPLYILPNVFEGTEARPAVDKTKCKLYVPEASVEAYKAADVWKEFGDNIIGIKDPQGMESIQPSAISHQKVIKDGQLLIEKDGKTYNAFGTEVR